MDETISKKIDQFFRQFRHQTFRKGEMLIRADEEPSGIFFLVNGTVREYAISKKGEEQVLNIFKAGTFFPMSWAINNTPNEYYFEAQENLEVFKAPKEEAVEFLKSNPDVLFDLLARVYKGTDGLLSRLSFFMAGEAYERVITELLILAKRFGESNGKNYQIKITEKEIANTAGIARETVSRELKILRDKKLVELEKNHLLILDIDKLQAELL